MGRDKAMLPFRGRTLAAHVASLAAEAAGSAVLIGDPVKYGRLGFPVLSDRSPGAGPLGGIETALSCTSADWNLVLACDMPALSTAFLCGLLGTAERLRPDALVPAGPSGRLEPLCAVYHQRSGRAFHEALDRGVRRISEALAALDMLTWKVDDSAWFENLNTPEEWISYARQ